VLINATRAFWYNGEPPLDMRGYQMDKASRMVGYTVIRQVRATGVSLIALIVHTCFIDVQTIAIVPSSRRYSRTHSIIAPPTATKRTRPTMPSAGQSMAQR
jgi:hypothetical protein